jgi:hypothetical protein
VLALSVTEHPVAGAEHGDAAELLDVDVDEFARVAALNRLGGSSRERLPSPIRFSHNETVESGSPSTSAISDAVIRSRRSASIARTHWRGSCVGERRGRDERSSS